LLTRLPEESISGKETIPCLTRSAPPGPGLPGLPSWRFSWQRWRWAFTGHLLRGRDYQRARHDVWEKEEVRKFRDLVQTLKKTLKDIKVFKVGKVEADVYIVGRTESGDWAGLKTKVVET